MNAPFGLPAELSELSDDYEFIAELGRGGSAVVYHAVDQALGRDVAIKVVHPRATSPNDDPVARLAREARTVAQLHHPNIVTVFAVRRIRSGGLALVLEFVPGSTLKASIQHDGPFSPERTERVLRDVAAALAYAHARGVIHRDVKPENVFLDTDSGRALLSDFGIARSGDVDSMTMTGTAIGTPFYMSPEQVDGALVDGRSDLYSLGLVAWEMLTGRRPWDGESLYNVIYKQKHADLPPIEALRGGIPYRLQYIVERMLQKRPGARWAGADGLLAQLNHSVLPSDYARWQAALPRRIERARADERAAVAARALAEPPTVASSTLQFDRVATATSANRAEPHLSGDALADTRRLSLVATDDEFGAASTGAELRGDASPQNGSFASALGATMVQDYSADAEPVWGDAGAAVGVPRPSRRRWWVAASGVAAIVALGATIVATGGLRDARAALARVTAPAARVATLPPASAPSSGSGDATPAPPAIVAESPNDVIAAGGRSSCTVTFGAVVYCWGANDRGQLGDATGAAHLTPTPVNGALAFAEVSVGLSHGCALTRTGDVYCWGANSRGQLGDATFVRRIAPVRIAGPGAYRSVRAGSAHSCALALDGSVRCWGANDRGQLGSGATLGGDSPIPAPVMLPPGRHATMVAVGSQHGCALLDDARIVCWGVNGDGQLGDGTHVDHATPTVMSSNDRFVAVVAGGAHSCALTSDRQVVCWGRGDDGQLGVNDRRAQPSPVRVKFSASTPVTALSAGTAHSCALGTDGDAWCWGRNTHGELGDGTVAGRLHPVPVRTRERFAALSAGSTHSCAVGVAGAVFCWGFNPDGQLGDSTYFRRLTPVAVALPPGVTASTLAAHR